MIGAGRWHCRGPAAGRIGQDLGVPAATVRGWLRRLRPRAEAMRRDAMYQLGFIGGTDPMPPGPGSPLADAQIGLHRKW